MHYFAMTVSSACRKAPSGENRPVRIAQNYYDNQGCRYGVAMAIACNVKETSCKCNHNVTIIQFRCKQERLQGHWVYTHHVLDGSWLNDRKLKDKVKQWETWS